MKRLEKQPESIRPSDNNQQDAGARLESQSLSDVESYPYPKRIKDEQTEDDQDRDMRDAGTSGAPAPAHASAYSRPTEDVVSPARSETNSLESIWLDIQIERWEDEGGHIPVIAVKDPLS